MHYGEIGPDRTFTGVMTRSRRTGDIALRCATGERPGRELLEKVTADLELQIIEVVETAAGSDYAREFYLGEGAVNQ